MNNNMQQSMQSKVKELDKIDIYEKEFYKIIEDKNIEISKPADVQKVERIFSKTLNDMLKIIESDKFNDDEKIILSSRFIIDFHVRFAEKYNFNPYEISSYFGKYNEEIFEKAVRDIKKFV